MSYLVLDVETTTKNKGHPFTPSNKLCCVGLKGENGSSVSKIEYDDSPYGASLDYVRRAVERCDTLVGFNIKFDLHWLRRYGIDFSGKRIFDCQIAYFIQNAQKNRLPSLNEAAEYYGFPPKLDVVETEYWSKGIDTTNVPWDILSEYAMRDVELTEQVYLKQLEWLSQNPKLKKLHELQCRDLLVLEEMEWNGLLFDRNKCIEQCVEVEAECNQIINELNDLVGTRVVNWNSTDHVSSILYGGTIEEAVKEPYLFYYKDPKREPVWKTKTVIKEHYFPRLYEPLPNTRLAKEEKWSTSTSVLGELLKVSSHKHERKIITLMLKLSELNKLHDYLKGLPELLDEMCWVDNFLHGNLNQCSTITGRLSSNKPNQQNMPPKVQELIRSRYG